MASSHAPILTPCQEDGLRLLRDSQDNIFLTGAAGSGKSFLIRHYMKGLDLKEYPLLASTGAAAVLIGGRTFHSFFGLGIMQGGIEATLDRVLKRRQILNRLRQIKNIIIDEISMIDSQAFECAELIARLARESSRPWGGIRVICVGDFYQLPPVSHTRQKPWAFLSPAWQKSQFNSIVLKTLTRSNDNEFNQVLNFIRTGTLNENVSSFLSRYTDESFSDPDKTHLFARRNRVDQFNQQKLDQLDAPKIQLPTEYGGSQLHIEQLKKNAPIPENIYVKKHALIMIRINDPKLKYVNGSTGYVVDVDKDSMIIELKKSGRIVELEKTTFSLLDGDGEEVAYAKNFPVNLAYATTIHKSQGSTLDEMVCDLQNLWEPGQAYVALSRLRSAQGLQLIGWNEESILYDPLVQKFYESLQ